MSAAAWWETRFGRRVRKYGISRLAGDLDVDKDAIYQWIIGRTAPRPKHAAKIIGLMRGLSLEHIYEHRLIVRASASSERFDENHL